MLGSRAGVNEGEVETQDHVSDYYELMRYRKPFSRAYHLDNVQRMCGLVKMQGNVLDNGCGNGFFLNAVARENLATRFIGLDISSSMLEKAKPHGCPLVHGDSCRLPFKDATFDTIFARSLLHHLPEPDLGVAEMFRVLKPGGELVLLDTHKTTISDLPRRIANRGEHFDSNHKNFVVHELTAMLQRRMVVDRIEFMGYVGYVLLGFPDIYDFSKFLPLQFLCAPLIWFDRLLARIPGVRRLGWGVIIKAHRAA
jgi:ubiquinone/menaquinone biosynthesis C-methylase UbiE